MLQMSCQIILEFVLAQQPHRFTAAQPITEYRKIHSTLDSR